MNRRLALISFGVAAVLLILWFMFLWSPQGNKLTDAKKRSDAAETQNSSLEVRLTRLKAAQKDAPELMAKGERLRRAIPETPELAQFILDANDAASQSGVDFLSISPTPPSPGVSAAAPSEVRLSISVTGTYFEVLDYLDRLDDLPRLVVVDSLGLTPGGGDSNTGSQDAMSVAITARMFTTAAPPTTAPVNPAAGAAGAAGSTTTTTAPGGTTATTQPTAGANHG